jgi:hypothetical protein
MVKYGMDFSLIAIMELIGPETIKPFSQKASSQVMLFIKVLALHV